MKSCFRHYDILAKTRCRRMTKATFSRHARALLSIEKISHSLSLSS